MRDYPYNTFLSFMDQVLPIHPHSFIHSPTQTFLLEKFRIAQRPNGEGNFNILYQLIAGADEQLRSELLLNNAGEEAEEPNLYYEPLDDVSLWTKYTCT